MADTDTTMWVDADACPSVVKDILFKAADRRKMNLVLVANQYLKTPPSKYIRAIQVPAGFDVADDEIVRQIQAGDLVITSDIPLANEVIEKGGDVLSPRGERYTKDNIAGRLNMRDFMETMRSSGIQTGGPPAFSQQDRKAFGDQLDRWLAKR